jgi:hypothetical protein
MTAYSLSHIVYPGGRQTEVDLIHYIGAVVMPTAGRDRMKRGKWNQFSNTPSRPIDSKLLSIFIRRSENIEDILVPTAIWIL